MTRNPEASLQNTYAPGNACFGCGPANQRGLQIKSHVEGERVVADWTPEDHHAAFEGVLNGGIIGALLDCHSNWTAIHYLMQRDDLDHAPCCVTLEFNVKLRRPTPTDTMLHLEARVTEASEDRATVYAELSANDKLCATCEGVFVRVKPGHPAYHRW